jgi:hypothetical protein
VIGGHFTEIFFISFCFRDKWQLSELNSLKTIFSNYHWLSIQMVLGSFPTIAINP